MDDLHSNLYRIGQIDKRLDEIFEMRRRLDDEEAVIKEERAGRDRAVVDIYEQAGFPNVAVEVAARIFIFGDGPPGHGIESMPIVSPFSPLLEPMLRPDARPAVAEAVTAIEPKIPSLVCPQCGHGTFRQGYHPAGPVRCDRCDATWDLGDLVSEATPPAAEVIPGFRAKEAS